MNTIQGLAIALTISFVLHLAVAKETCPLEDSTTRPGQVAGVAAFQYNPFLPNAPAQWGNLDCSTGRFRKFRSCMHCGPSSCSGKSQSPIYLRVSKVEPKASGIAPKISLSSKAHVIFKKVSGNFQVNCEAAGTCGSVMFKGEKFLFDNIHMHSISEHSLDFRRFPGELHFVHRSDAGNLLVVALFFRTRLFGKNPDFQDFLDIASSGQSDVINLRRLLGQARSNLIVYTGSLTTPPCSEGVTFVVSPRIARASRAQIREFRKLLGGKRNNRPLQPLNGRVVTLFK